MRKIHGFAKTALRSIGRTGLRIPAVLLPKKSTVTVGGLHLVVSPKTDIGYQLFTNQAFEFAEVLATTSMLLATMKQSEKFSILDIGANVGTHSLLWAKNLPGSTVHAFEPSPETFQQLAEHVVTNGLSEQIQLHNLAVGSSRGPVKFFVASDAAYSGLKDTKRKKITKTIDVELIRLDDWADEKNIQNIRLIKIDVEGLENDVLIGALDCISSHMPIIMMEIYKGTASNQTPEETIRAVIQLGYKAFTVKHGQISEFTGTHEDRAYSYLFIPLERRPS